jgi:hypothetical protein
MYSEFEGSTQSLQNKHDVPPPPPLPRKDIPQGAIPVLFETPPSGKYPRGVFHVLGTDMHSESYFNPLSRNSCSVNASSVQVGILATLVENAVGYFSTEDEHSPWFEVSLGPLMRLYPDHYVIGGSETGHRDDMMRDWILEGSLDGETGELIREHRDEQCFVDTQGPCGPKGWQCFSLPPSGPYRHFRLKHTGVTISGSRAMQCSAFEVFGHLVVEER